MGKSTFFVVRTKTHRHDKNLSPESVLWSGGGGDVGVEIEMLYTDAMEVLYGWTEHWTCVSVSFFNSRKIEKKIERRKGLTCQNDDIINNNNHEGK